LGATEWLAQCVAFLFTSTATAKGAALHQLQQCTEMVGECSVAYAPGGQMVIEHTRSDAMSVTVLTGLFI
jgi:hypothetical protein